MTSMDLSCFSWRKSSFSGGSGNACVEVGLPPEAWRKSSYSGGSGNDCVELAVQPTATAIRDSKNPAGGTVLMNGAGWTAFQAALKADRLH